MHDTFINAIHNKQKLRVTFLSKEDGNVALERLCAPMDYGPSRRYKDEINRYHFWDYDSDKKSHVLSLLPDRIINIEETSEAFEPAEFVTWDTSWFIERNWGIYS